MLGSPLDQRACARQARSHQGETFLGRTVADVGEFGLIDRIAAIIGPTAAIVGIGDDTAILDQPGANYLLATVDMLVEGIHFHRPLISPSDLGRRALAVNLSDIAAMGGTPTFALTSIAVPHSTVLSYVEDLYRGLRAEAAQFGVGIVGGNVTAIEGPLAIDVVLLGQVGKQEVVKRSGAQIGDVIAATGFLGSAAAGRLIGDHPALAARKELQRIRVESLVPVPRVRAGQRLAAAQLVHAMLDLSDGLGSDVHHLAGASGVGAVVSEQNLPVSIAAREVGRALDRDPYELALYGGEDYELLMTLPEREIERARDAVGEVPLAVIGTVLHPDQGVLLETAGGRRVPLEPRGWRHF